MHLDIPRGSIFAAWVRSVDTQLKRITRYLLTGSSEQVATLILVKGGAARFIEKRYKAFESPFAVLLFGFSGSSPFLGHHTYCRNGPFTLEGR